ncbi:MAG: CotH kinase family protein, partial [Flavobacteriaceae bacterium]|nr:CotH kinase family protein [Flavobacteriaceae bacterium]
PPDQYLETYFLYAYPKAADITNAQKEYIQGYIHDFETALINDNFATETRTYSNYKDLDSFVDFFIINEITGNIDGYRLSTYMHKQRGGKLKMGPIWDLNIGYAKQGRVPVTDWIANYNVHISQDAWMVPFWWPRLLEDPIFKQALKSRWTTLRANTFSNASVLGRVTQTANYLKDNGAIDRNYNKWTGIAVDYDGEISILKNYLENRLQWMDQTINNY